MSTSFPTSYQKILERLYAINPVLYGRSRNHIEGAVTHISPYLTHGVVSLPFVRSVVLQKYSTKDSYAFIFELAWREFFQRVYSEEQNTIFNDLKSDQRNVMYDGIPQAILEAKTGIVAIDTAYKNLYATGYMHNHTRMWSAMLATNVGHYAWWDVSRHMFYYLLDGDKASNTLSWQWVAGTFSSKQYVANQEMINKFSQQKQKNSYIDVDVSELTTLCPRELVANSLFTLTTDFSLFKDIHSLGSLSGDTYLLYSIWTLDPIWKPVSAMATKVLFIDREELVDFPMSSARIEFIVELSKNIPSLHIVVGSQDELIVWASRKNIYRKSHPAIQGWPGTISLPEYLFPQIDRVPRGFMSYWKKCEVYI
jgi:deoxyribodipyrimidine photo-lyase